MRTHHTWVVILELGQVIDIIVDDNVEVVALIMRRDVGFRERLGHFIYGGDAETGI